MKDKRSILFICTFLLLIPTLFSTCLSTLAFGIEELTEPEYIGITNYYDNRKAVVTVTADDWDLSTSAKFEAMSMMLTSKQIYFTGGIITGNAVVWTQIQYWLDQGYAEAASHARTHPSTVPYDDYDSEIGGSKQDIIDNLALPSTFASGGTEYVYSWIEPYGVSDSTIRQKLGEYKYLADRMVGNDDGWATWDPVNGLFNRIGYSIRMETPLNGGVDDATILNSKFDSVYNAGGIYHLMTHPQNTDWDTGQYADLHTTYISNRKDVWYVNFGLLYLYHWVNTQNVVQVTSMGSLNDKIFKINISPTNRQNYGATYPITYVFDIPQIWTNAYVNYRFRQTDSWTRLETKTSLDYFNGINAVRFDYANDKTYISIGFSNISNEIYLQILPQDTQPTADFTASPTSGTEPLTVSFTDTSTSYDGIISWSWSFGDGKTSTTQNPIHTYTTSGSYTVSLTVSDTDGDTDTETKTNYIAVSDSTPVASFTYSPLNPLEGNPLSFDASGSTGYDQPLYYNWDFGDGTNGNGVNPTHNYAQNGSYPVKLTVIDGDGSTTSISKTINVADKAPVANFSAIPIGGPEPLQVNFQDLSNSYDGITSWTWDFGDGNTGSERNPIHDYIADGFYTVTLTVREADGNQNIETKTQYIAVADTVPTAEFSYSPGAEALTINFTDNSTSYDALASWTWNFGDGKTSTERNPLHKFPDNGNFTVSLTVSDADGSTDTITKQITVLNVAPTAEFTIESSPKPTIDEDITFIDQSFDLDGHIVLWLWDFGDGTTSNLQNVTHRYHAIGTFTVNLTVTDDNGGTAIISKSISIYDVTSPTTLHDYDGLWHNSDFTIKLTATDNVNEVQATYYRINDGTIMSVQAQGQPFISKEGYNKLEYWSVDLAGNEEAHKIISDIKLDKTKPIANAGPDQTVNEDSPMRFDGSASSDNINIVSYTWTFVDGTSQILTEMNPTQTFSTPGNYVVILRVTDAAFNSATDTVVITVIDITPPLINIGNSESVVENAPVNLDATGSSDNVAIANYHWAFGDGASENCTMPSTVHTYTKAGVYKVTLTAVDAVGNLNSTAISIVVNSDTDGDLVSDYVDTDDDNDGIPDDWEILHGLNPLDASDADLDFDGDGLSNLTEFQTDNDPNVYSWSSPFPLFVVLSITIIGLVPIIGTLFIKKLRVKQNRSRRKRGIKTHAVVLPILS